MAPSTLVVHMSHLEREGLRMLSEQQGISEEQVLRKMLRAVLPELPVKQKRRYQRRHDIWDKVTAYAVARVAEHGYVSVSDLVRNFGIAQGTANDCIDRLIYELGWTSEPAIRPSRGKVAGPKV